MSPAAAEYVTWAHSVCTSGLEVAGYREPALTGARAPSAAEAAARELEDASAVLTKAVLREGEPDSGCPVAGNEVVLHVSLRLADASERLLSSTDAAEGGRGVPLRTQLGDTCTLLRGAELALGAFRRGESSVLRLPPEFAWAHASAATRGLRPPRGVSPRSPLLCVLTLLDFYPVRLVADAASPAGLVSKRLLAEGHGLETPHAPYEVEVAVAASLSGQAAPLAPSRVLRFRLGAGAVPPALDAAVASMRPGERASVWCAPACALQPAPLLPELPSVAPDGIEYALELLRFTQVRDFYGDGSLLKRRTAAGVGDFPVDCPVHDCVVTVALRAWALLPDERVELDGVPEEQPLRCELGTGELPPGLEAAVRLMLPGERACVTAQPRHGYDGQPRGRWARPAALPAGFAGVTEWEVLLLSFEKPLNWHAATPAQCLEDAIAAKAAGVALYKGGCWALARARFESLASRLNGLRGLEEEDEAAANALRASCLLNAAAAAQQLGEHAIAAAHATAILERLDPDSGKALYRRAISRTAMGDWTGAAADLDAARSLVDAAEPGSTEEFAALDRQAAKLRAAQRAAASETRSQLRGFLDKP